MLLTPCMSYKKTSLLCLSGFAMLAINPSASLAGTSVARLFVTANVVRICFIAFDTKAVGVDCGGKNSANGSSTVNALRAIDLSQVAHSIERFEPAEGVAQIMVTF